jgi:5'(3')-deoxyribonucleotidase
MGKNKIYLYIVVMLIVLTAFLNRKKDNSHLIQLRFNLSYEGDAISKQKTGLIWALSFLGATIPKNSFETALIKKSATLYELDIAKVGFNEKAITAMRKIIISLKNSEEYKNMNGIDLGEFVVYTLGSSWHYYEITGALPTYQQFKQQYNWQNAIVFPVLNSSVAKHHRNIKMSQSTDVRKMAFIAEEGEGEIDKNTFAPKTFEVFDIMANGQLRFAIYDSKGQLSHASEKIYGNAGKPSKCLWCHEIEIQTLYTQNDSLPNYISPRQFKNTISERMNLLINYRKNLNSDVNFNNRQDHELMELLYINFMEPSAYKLSYEWNKKENDINAIFQNITKHPHKEHTFLKNLMERNTIKGFSPYKTVQLPDSILEENSSEPNVFRK